MWHWGHTPKNLVETRYMSNILPKLNNIVIQRAKIASALTKIVILNLQLNTALNLKLVLIV